MPFSNFDSDDDDSSSRRHEVKTAPSSSSSSSPSEWTLQKAVGVDGYTAYTRVDKLTTHWLIVKGEDQPVPANLNTVALFDIVTVSYTTDPITDVTIHHCEVENLQASDLPYGVGIIEVIFILQKLYSHGTTADPKQFVSLVMCDGEEVYPLNHIHAGTRQTRREAGLMRHYEGPTTFN